MSPDNFYFASHESCNRLKTAAAATVTRNLPLHWIDKLKFAATVTVSAYRDSKADQLNYIY